MWKIFHLIVVLRWLGHVTIPHKVSLHGHVLHLRQRSPFIQIFLCRAAQFSPGHKLIQGGSQCPSPPSHLLVPHHILERYRLLITNNIQSGIHRLVGNRVSLPISLLKRDDDKMVEVMATILVVVEIKGLNSIISLSHAWSAWQFSLSETLHYLKHSLGYLGTHLGSRQKTKSYWDLRAPQNHQVDDDYDPRVPVGALHSGPHHPQEGHDGGGGDALEHAVHGLCLHPLCATLCCWRWKQKKRKIQNYMNNEHNWHAFASNSYVWNYQPVSYLECYLDVYKSWAHWRPMVVQRGTSGRDLRLAPPSNQGGLKKKSRDVAAK